MRRLKLVGARNGLLTGVIPLAFLMRFFILVTPVTVLRLGILLRMSFIAYPSACAPIIPIVPGGLLLGNESPGDRVAKTGAESRRENGTWGRAMSC
jgi:hypothetical protein